MQDAGDRAGEAEIEADRHDPTHPGPSAIRTRRGLLVKLVLSGLVAVVVGAVLLFLA